MEIRLQKSIIKNINLLLLVLLSSYVSAQEVVPAAINQYSDLSSKSSSFTLTSRLKKIAFKKIIENKNFEATDRIFFESDTNTIKSRSLLQIKDSNFNAKANSTIYSKISEKFRKNIFVSSKIVVFSSRNFKISFVSTFANNRENIFFP